MALDRRAPDSRRQKADGRKKKSKTAAFLSDFRDLKPGDFVVHIDHGIGRFGGLQMLDLGPRSSVGLHARVRPLVNAPVCDAVLCCIYRLRVADVAKDLCKIVCDWVNAINIECTSWCPRLKVPPLDLYPFPRCWLIWGKSARQSIFDSFAPYLLIGNIGMDGAEARAKRGRKRASAQAIIAHKDGIDDDAEVVGQVHRSNTQDDVHHVVPEGICMGTHVRWNDINDLIKTHQWKMQVCRHQVC